MANRRWSDWDGFKDLPDGSYTPPEGGGGSIPPELIDKINKSVSKEDLNNIISDFNHSKDVVFKMSSPIKVGPQHSTDIPYPHEGIAKYVNMSVSMDSTMISNIIVSVEKYITKSKEWISISGMVQLNIGQGIVVKEIDSEISPNDRIRINVLEGDPKGIKDLTIILNIE